MKHLAVPALLLVAACGASPRAPAKATTASNTFGWSPPCRVPATEVMIAGKTTVKLRYDVVVTADDGGSLRVTREHVEFVETDGKPIASAERDLYTTAARWLELYPAVIIDESGAVVDLGDITPYVDAMIAHSKLPPDAAERAREFQLSPAGRGRVDRAQLARWSSWVALWREWKLTPGQHVEAPMNDELGDGTEGTMRLEHLGYADARAHLRVVMTAKGEGLAEFIPDVVLQIAESSDANALLDLGETTTRMTYEAITAPATLRPDRASYEAVTQIPIEGQAPGEHREGHETTFDWAHATGCGAP